MYFAIFMVTILLLTGVIWLLDILVLSKTRTTGDDEPWYVEYSKSFFPVILLVFVIRSFIVEPFKIPSGSMMPTLLAGDYILVNKFTYGLREPISNTEIISMNKPERGDVFVFRYPPDVTVNYIKRVVGLPGDTIQYQDKQLMINGQPLNVASLGDYQYVMKTPNGGQQTITAMQLAEQLGDVKHDLLVHPQIEQDYRNPNSPGAKLMLGEAITVPEGHYFAMGDNRDNSSDSRVWGFVSSDHLVGKAFYIWFNFDEFSRIGNHIN